MGSRRTPSGIAPSAPDRTVLIARLFRRFKFGTGSLVRRNTGAFSHFVIPAEKRSLFPAKTAVVPPVIGHPAVTQKPPAIPAPHVLLPFSFFFQYNTKENSEGKGNFTKRKAPALYRASYSRSFFRFRQLPSFPIAADRKSWR